MKRILILFLVISINQGYCQIDNGLFDGENDRIAKLDSSTSNNQNSAFGLGGLNYFKNNEFQEKHNPGETLFGTLLWAGYNLKLSKTALVTIGALYNIKYGSSSISRIPLFPIIQLRYKLKNTELIVGSIQSNTKHNLQEAQINIENSFNQPLEYGIQYLLKNSWLNYDLWLNWRQMAIPQIAQQEIISFGQSASLILHENKIKNAALSIPISALIYHKGGESLNIQKPIVNDFNGSIGGKLFLGKIGLEISNITFFSRDFSPIMTHTFKSGFANQSYLKMDINKNQFLCVIYYYAKEYYSPLASNLFLSENNYSPILTDRIRNFTMIRYQYKKELIAEKLSIDLRAEPIYHIESNKFAFSTGLYFKYNIGSVIL